jgi:hypothetical protein
LKRHTGKPRKVRDRKEINSTVSEEKDVPDTMTCDEGINIHCIIAEEQGAVNGAYFSSQTVKVISLRSLTQN